MAVFVYFKHKTFHVPLCHLISARTNQSDQVQHSPDLKLVFCHKNCHSGDLTSHPKIINLIVCSGDQF